MSIKEIQIQVFPENVPPFRSNCAFVRARTERPGGMFTVQRNVDWTSQSPHNLGADTRVAAHQALDAILDVILAK